MSIPKQVFNKGFLWLRNEKHGLVDVNVVTSQTRVDIKDTVQNNDLLAGIGVWTFTATIFVREGVNILPSLVAESIVFQYGSRAWVGTGFMFEITEVGAIDNAIVYNISGEFHNGSDQIELIRDTSDDLIDVMSWDDFTNWISVGAWIVLTSPPPGYDLLVPLLDGQGSANNPETTRSNVDFTNGETYRFYMPYKVLDSVENAHQYDLGIGALPLADAVGDYLLNYTFTAGAEDQIEITQDNGATNTSWVRYYFILLGEVINSI